MFADGWLANMQFFGRPGETLIFINRYKDFKVMHIHGFTPLPYDRNFLIAQELDDRNNLFVKLDISIKVVGVNFYKAMEKHKSE
jgi:hypothetical protein